MSVRTGQLDRGLSALSLDADRDAQAARDERDRTALKERVEQYQVPIEALVGAMPGHAEVDIDFRAPFIAAPEQRDSDFDRPHFAFGYELVSGRPVTLTAHIASWKVNDELTTGCVVHLTAVDHGLADWQWNESWQRFDYLVSGTREKRKLRAHLTFQGFGSTAPDADDDENMAASADTPEEST